MAQLPVIRKVLGWDDWLIYARDAQGVLVYAVMECDGRWLSAPHGGFHKCSCPEPNMAVCRVDSSWMLAQVTRHPKSVSWQAADYPLGVSDEAFMAHSRAAYLCD